MVNLVQILDERGFSSSRAPQTIRVYRRALGRLAAAGIAAAADATLAKFSAAMEARLQRVQPQTARIEGVALLAVLGHLERTGRFDHARLTSLRRALPVAAMPELLSADWLTAAEVEDLAAAARETSSLVELTVRLAAWSGMRAGELARLRWDDVDLGTRCLRVKWTARHRIKTNRERVVPICAPLLGCLTAHPGALLTRASGQGLVLGCGRSLSAGVLSRRLIRLARRSGLRGSLLLLRHTRASWWVQEGVPLAKVASWLGNSPEVVARHYAGLLRGYDPDVERGAAG